MTLKDLLEGCGLSQRDLARALELSPAAVSDIVNHDRWPKTADTRQLQAAIRKALRAAGANESRVKHLFRPSRARVKAEPQPKETIMLLRRQGLFPKTKKHFGLMADPFDEIRGAEDVFLSSEIRYVRESMLHIAKHGGFLAVIGESGSGKSTLRRDMVDRIIRDKLPVHVIEPYVLAMEDNDTEGKSLKALHIAEAIMATVAPGESIKSSPEARFRQLHRVLRDSGRTGHAHVLVIEEAHGLPLKTLKHLKRFLELEDGFRKLLSVILLGQPELKHKLSEANHEVREVVQRCEVVELKPMNGSLAGYVAHRFERVGAEAGKVITEDGIEALRSKLTGPASRGGANDSVSLVYPLAVGNMITAAMNLAADVGAPVVDPGIIAQV
ncbi:MAG: AAA family ATPase [Pseudodesulfovibrio sp.]|uniref:Helix-turn-helix domain protein n=1 Tax=Pseudodesulfovibrio aespoeensis (strain ATCC 700646 / DSM 10631 / Aspo-2) TaxID=643562 RepID=E6VUC3_PSEA9|nr:MULTISPECIES: AAA family ATPase [Pseudodesulfovibrio]MBU4191364.1 AAA family ATPase [Pseudomonadota bacterium]ADU63430.1 helix-turn-helix domain protein [Pseudodesulfovibrio aespoeensis Aspo-2]MBU4243477.1 AAA family ATPase [Pseudomonadota bacterium]MBU4380248.1 AAA family ATPase [Pseudomonadota bacterium]MBU4517287.1 AAA family ATPase [Pseudomonadota bacterium]